MTEGLLPPVPLNDLSRGLARDAEHVIEATRRVVESGYVIHGPEHELFERELAHYLGTGHVLGVASGTDALELSLKAAMPEGRTTVLTAANAGGYTTTAAHRGAYSVVYADVEEATLCLSARTVDAALTPDVGVVVVTHLYGNLIEMGPLVQLCRERGVRLLEDCAQAIGARRGQTMAGGFGDIAAISFYPTKNLGALGDGGAVTTNEPDLADRVRSLRQYGWGSKYRVELAGGVNSRLDELQAAFLRLRLPLLDSLNERRRHIVSRYVDAAAGLPEGLLEVLSADGSHHVAHLAVARSERRDLVRAQLLDHGVRTDVHFPIPDFDQPGFAASTPPVDLPVTSAAAAQVLSLPCFPEMTDDEVDRVCVAITALR